MNRTNCPDDPAWRRHDPETTPTSEPGREQAHDPGDPACVQHDQNAIYTMVLHICATCRSAQDHSECSQR